MAAGVTRAHEGFVRVDRPDAGTLVVRLAGAWHLRHELPPVKEIAAAISALPAPARVVIEAEELQSWDSSILTFLMQVSDHCAAAEAVVDISNLPAGLRRMVELAQAVPQQTTAAASRKRPPWLERLGRGAMDWSGAVSQFLAFVGETAIAFSRLLTGRARYRKIDLMILVQECGVQALGIVTLISYLVGIILAFMGAVQLQQFGASIYVADLVGIAMVREMGAMMTAIIMAGRTGAAFAAQLGTMKVTQEIDALETMGISPVEFLVLPRLIALIVMMPLLCLYADAIGILGGATVGATMLRISFLSYLKETQNAVTLTMLWGGLLKALVYGALIALASCLRGFECGKSSAAVGEAATRAVVTSIVLVVAACGTFAFVFNLVGI